MKRIYVTNQCCSIRRAVFASCEINGERPSRNGDYNLWPYGIRETKRIADGTAPIVKNAGGGSETTPPKGEKLCEKKILGMMVPWGKIRKNPNKNGVFGEEKIFCVRGLTWGLGYSILAANQGACRALRNEKG